MKIYLTIDGKIKSRDLYKELKEFGLNVTDFINRTVVYGNIKKEDYKTIILICERYGKVII